MKIKCIITDDEPLARKGLEKHANKIDFLEVVAQCENALQLNEALEKQAIDLLFLDINMPHLNGIDFLKLKKTTGPKVILCTAYPEYALEGYELEVLDYLLKPISFERFYKAASKAKAYFKMSAQPKETDYFFIKCDKRLEKISFQDILFLESMQNYVKIITSHETLVAHTTLKALKLQLPSSGFLQPHKSYVVAIDKIKAIEGNQLIIGQHKVPISRYQKEQALEKIINRKL